MLIAATVSQVILRTAPAVNSESSAHMSANAATACYSETTGTVSKLSIDRSKHIFQHPCMLAASQLKSMPSLHCSTSLPAAWPTKMAQCTNTSVCLVVCTHLAEVCLVAGKAMCNKGNTWLQAGDEVGWTMSCERPPGCG